MADIHMTSGRNPHLGGTLDELLEEDGSLADACAVTVKRVLAWQVDRTMSDMRIGKSEMADAWGPAAPRWPTCSIPKTRR